MLQADLRRSAKLPRKRDYKGLAATRDPLMRPASPSPHALQKELGSIPGLPLPLIVPPSPQLGGTFPPPHSTPLDSQTTFILKLKELLANSSSGTDQGGTRCLERARYQTVLVLRTALSPRSAVAQKTPPRRGQPLDLHLLSNALFVSTEI